MLHCNQAYHTDGIALLLVLSPIFDHETTSQQLWWHYTGCLCVNVSHTNYVPWCKQSCMDTGRSTWWTWWGLCHNLPARLIYVQLKRGISIYRALKLHTDRDPFLLQLQLHGCGITWRLTFNGSPPFPPSRDISSFICLWLHIPVSATLPTYAVGLHYVGPSPNVLSDQYNSYWIRTQTANSQVPSLHAVYTFTIAILSRWKFNYSDHAECFGCVTLLLLYGVADW